MSTKVLERRPSFSIFPTEDEVRRANTKMFLLILPLAGFTVIDGLLFGLFRVLRGRKFTDPEIRESWYHVKRFFQYKWKYAWEKDFRQAVKDYKTKAREVRDRTSDQLHSFKRRLDEFEITDSDIYAGVEFMGAMAQMGYVALVVTYAVVIIGGFGTYGAIKYYNVPDPAPALVKEKPIEYTPQEADVQDANYGPWFNRGEVLQKVNDPNFLSMAKVDGTGTVQYSKTVTAPKTDNFKPLNFHERVINPSVTEKGQITFRDQERNTFTVNPGQVFIFEGYKSKAFVFDKAGKLYGIDPKELIIN